MKIKDLRNRLHMSQEELANRLGISTRTIRRYENGQINQYKEEYIRNILNDMLKVDEEHGIVKLDDMIATVSDIANKYNVEYVYLFGSYARGSAKPESDIDLLISTKEKGLSYFGLVEEFRTNLKKKIDLINVIELVENNDLLLQILKDGIKIYDQNKKW